MIKIKKGPKPKRLIDNAATWTKIVKQHHAAGQDFEYMRDRYRHVQIKLALEQETHAKCVYCEASILANNYVIVEHVRPWSTFPWLGFWWYNLVLICFWCNDWKRHSWPVVNPIFDDPSIDLTFADHLVVPLTPLGTLTESTIKLNRPNLFEDRRKRLKEFTDVFERLTRWQRLDVINDLGAGSVISKYYDPSWPFSAMFQTKIESLRESTERACHQDISDRAEQIWKNNGCKNGTATDDWFEAKRQLIAENTS
jgi:uncharacterized protein (TIGR02646 family)